MPRPLPEPDVRLSRIRLPVAILTHSAPDSGSPPAQASPVRVDRRTSESGPRRTHAGVARMTGMDVVGIVGTSIRRTGPPSFALTVGDSIAGCGAHSIESLRQIRRARQPTRTTRPSSRKRHRSIAPAPVAPLPSRGSCARDDFHPRAPMANPATPSHLNAVGPSTVPTHPRRQHAIPTQGTTGQRPTAGLARGALCLTRPSSY